MESHALLKNKKRRMAIIGALCFTAFLFAPIIVSFATTYTQNILETIGGTPVVNPHQESPFESLGSSILAHVDPVFLESITGQPETNPNQEIMQESIGACATVNTTTGSDVYNSCDTGYTVFNPDGVSIHYKKSGTYTTSTASNITADAGSDLSASGILNCTYTANYKAYINQEGSKGFQVYSNVSLAGSAAPIYLSSKNQLQWGNSSTPADHAKVCVPAGYTVTGSSTPTSKNGTEYDLNSTSGPSYVTADPPGSQISPGQAASTSTVSSSTSSTISLPYNPMVHPEIPPGSENSTNWAGYAIYATPGTVHQAAGSWILPKTPCSLNGESFVAYWVGIDGFNSSTVEQIGLVSNCNHGSVNYQAWYEFYPLAPVFLQNFTIRPSDVMYASVSETDLGFTLVLDDNTTGASFIHTATNVIASLSSAEFIVEDPSTGTGLLPLAAFGSAYFGMNFTAMVNTNYVTANSYQSNIGAFPSFAISMVQNNTIMASVSPLSDGGTSFIVYGPTPIAQVNAGIEWAVVILIAITVLAYLAKTRSDKGRSAFDRSRRENRGIY